MLIQRRIDFSDLELLLIPKRIARLAYEYGIVFIAEAQAHSARTEIRHAKFDFETIQRLAPAGTEAVNFLTTRARAVRGADLVEVPTTDDEIRDVADIARSAVVEQLVEALYEPNPRPFFVDRALVHEAPLPQTFGEPIEREGYEALLDVRPKEAARFAEAQQDRADAWYPAAADAITAVVMGFPPDRLDPIALRGKRSLVRSDDPFAGLIESLRFRISKLDREFGPISPELE